MSSSLERTMTHVLLVVFSIVAVYPVVSILLLALSRGTDLVTGFTIPTDPTLDNFARAWTEGGLAQGLINSTIVTLIVVVVSVTLSVLAGYGLGAMRFPGSSVVFFVLITGLIIPYESLIIPLYQLFRGWGMTETLVALILPQIGLSVCLG
ncbi:MAG: carbohydrate ABC transporter permease, partial [Chloroflexi bacterium]|nr:carbohydrate ABC transporter permease [Chloroflexota bacterium]